MVTLLKHFTFSATNSQEFLTDWVRVPEEHKNWLLVYTVHSGISTSVGTLTLETTWDTGVTDNVSTGNSISSFGQNNVSITSGMGPMVRLRLAATADTSVVLSVWLTPKSD